MRKHRDKTTGGLFCLLRYAVISQRQINNLDLCSRGQIAGLRDNAYFLPPKIGMNIAPRTLARGALPTIKKLMRDGFDFDLIDARTLLPRRRRAGFLAKWLGKPFVVTARGGSLADSPICLPAPPDSGCRCALLLRRSESAQRSWIR